MEAEFWHQRWEQGEIGFHESQANPSLVAHVGKLNLAKGSRVFLPLCGKTLDIAWLLAQGYRVAGAELSALAINELFRELGVAPHIVAAGTLTHYSASNIDIFVGDVFDLSAHCLGSVDAIYDRAALVALPAPTRAKYTAHLTTLTSSAPQLLIAFEYDQALMDGPPFSVSGDEIQHLYAAAYHLEPVERKSIEGGLKGKVAAIETTWILRMHG